MNMELSPFSLYLIFQADGVHDLFSLVALVATFAAAGTTLFFIMYRVDPPYGHDPKTDKNPLTWVCFIAWSVLVVSAFGTVVTPTTKTLVAMYGIPAAIEGAKNVATSEVGQKAYGAVNKLLDDYLKSK